LATVNIGNLTFTHRGDYDGSTAYAKNDVVYYATNGNAYIAKQATTGNVPTNATYWSQFAQGSGGIWNAGLSLGSANQSVRVNSGGNALEFYTPSAGGVLQVRTKQDGTYRSINTTGLDTSAYEVAELTNTITLASASNYLMITGMINATQNSSYVGRGYVTYNHSGISETVIKSSAGSYGHTCRIEQSDNSGSTTGGENKGINLMLHPNTTNELTIKFRISCRNSSHPVHYNGNIGYSASDPDDGGATFSSLTLWEISGGLSPNIGNTTMAT
jgi:hypothetical protein